MKTCTEVVATSTWDRLHSSLPDPSSWVMFISKFSTLWECNWREALIGFQIFWWTTCFWPLLPFPRHCWCTEVMSTKAALQTGEFSFPHNNDFSEQNSKNVFLPYLPVLSPSGYPTVLLCLMSFSKNNTRILC